MSSYDKERVAAEIKRLEDEIWGPTGHRTLAEAMRGELSEAEVAAQHFKERFEGVHVRYRAHVLQQDLKMAKLKDLFHSYYLADTRK